MPSSQLKRLKASLRESGIVGPQKSKKQKRAAAQQQQEQQNGRSGSANNDRRVQRSVALENIREQFNPFDLKLNARGPKFAVTTSRPPARGPGSAGGVQGRPGAAKSLAEERVS
jgi:nucleolar protein 14